MVLTTLGTQQTWVENAKPQQRGPFSSFGLWCLNRKIGRVTAGYHTSYQKPQSFEGQSAFVCKGSRSHQIGWHSSILKTVTVIILINIITTYWFGCIFNLAQFVFLFNNCSGGEKPSDCIWKQCVASLGQTTLAVVLVLLSFISLATPLPACSEASPYLLFQMVWPVLPFRNELNPGLHWTPSVCKLLPF